MTVGADQDDFRAPKGEKTFEGSLSCHHATVVGATVQGHMLLAKRAMYWQHSCGNHHQHPVLVVASVYFNWPTQTAPMANVSGDHQKQTLTNRAAKVVLARCPEP